MDSLSGMQEYFIIPQSKRLRALTGGWNIKRMESLPISL